MTELLDHTRALYEITPLLVALYDPSDRMRYANAACRAAHFIAEGETPTWEEMVRRNHAARRGVVITTADFDAWVVSTRSRRGKVPYRTFETGFYDGRWVLVTETVAENGWMLTIAVDVTAFRSDERAVRQDRDRAISASHTDELTSVSNRRFVAARAADMLAAGGPGGCLCVLDLDNFKYINDRYGHQAGDCILRDFAVRIVGQVRRSDCFGRVGGEEFVLVLPATGVVEAELIVERMLAAVRLSRPQPEHPAFAYTFSAGIAQARAGDTFADIYGRADRALYLAKLDGRNRVRIDPSATGGTG
ncbi:GGDEF domain-containing protein [Xanthobacter dioxanivorans]|uniref:diguanylate cyclase n=1 Tax=Xanthobacter dioxanivorans TaxID=2528964 RepID=A0A974PKE9_9HYPH|nr:GGDEF domain-containing protein [Xanthobacter dioxanivorans]QRG04819.1 GGDEF domain-containing protein [Xanthobacter dioxanivorans]